MDATRTSSPWASLVVLCGAMLLVILDGTIVSVALPAIQADLGFDPALLSWTVNAYLIALGGLLLLAGRLGDRVGARRVLAAGVALFVLASVACGFATGPATLTAARFVQGVGAAAASAVVLGMIAALFPEPGQRARAMGVYAFVGAAGASIGTVLGGVLTATAGWRWIFWVNVPLGAAILVLIVAVVAPDRAPAGRPSQPLLRLAVFRSRSVSGGNAVQVLAVAGMPGFQYVAALYLQQGRGLDPAATGLAMLPVPVTIASVSLGMAGRAIARFGSRAVLVTGLAALVAGLLLLTADVVATAPVFVVLGVGAGLVLPAVAMVTMADAGPDDGGMLSGLSSTAQQVGGALGTALLAWVAAARTGAVAAAGASGPDALVPGFRLAFLVGAGVVAAGLVLAFAVVPGGSRSFKTASSGRATMAL
jgi:MFS family permease